MAGRKMLLIIGDILPEFHRPIIHTAMRNGCHVIFGPAPEEDSERYVEDILESIEEDLRAVAPTAEADDG